MGDFFQRGHVGTNKERLTSSPAPPERESGWEEADRAGDAAGNVYFPRAMRSEETRRESRTITATRL